MKLMVSIIRSETMGKNLIIWLIAFCPAQQVNDLMIKNCTHVFYVAHGSSRGLTPEMIPFAKINWKLNGFKIGGLTLIGKQPTPKVWYEKQASRIK